VACKAAKSGASTRAPAAALTRPRRPAHRPARRHASYLACPPGGKTCEKTGAFAGPAWGHVNVRNTTIDWFLTVNSNYTGLVTLHWYKVCFDCGFDRGFDRVC
jgi:hypothetical protein